MRQTRSTDNFPPSADVRAMPKDPHSTQALPGTHRMGLPSLSCTDVWNTFRAPETPAKSWLTEHQQDPCPASAAARHLLKKQQNDWTELKEDWDGNQFRNKLTQGVKIGACMPCMLLWSHWDQCSQCCPAFNCCLWGCVSLRSCAPSPVCLSFGISNPLCKGSSLLTLGTA